MMHKFENWFSDWVIRYRLWFILFSVVGVFVVLANAKEFNPTTDYRVFFGADNPQLLAFQELENTYSKSDNVLFVLTPKDGNIYTRETLSAIDYLSNEHKDRQGKAWDIPFARRVDSITNFQNLTAKGDDISAQALVSDAAKLTDADLVRIRAVVEAERSLIGRVVSAKGNIAAVNVTIELPGKSAQTETPDVVTASRKIVANMKTLFPNVQVRLVGMVPFNNAFTEASLNDVATLYPLALAFILLVLVVMLRSLVAVVLTLLITIASIAVAMSAALIIGLPITPPVMTAPVVILTVSVATSVHLLASFIDAMRSGMEKTAAIKESLRTNIEPVFFTSITDVIGFLSLNFAEVPPFRHMGNVIATGVVISFILAMTFLPAMLSILPIRIKPRLSSKPTATFRLGEFVIRHRTKLLWISTGVILLLVAMVPRNQLNDVFVEFFDQRLEIRRDLDYVQTHLTGAYPVEYSVDSGHANGLKNPEFLKETDRFVEWLRTQKEVAHAYTFVDTLKRIHRAVHEDRPEFYRIPDTTQLAADYLEVLYNNTVPYGFDSTNQVNIDYRSTRVTASLRTVSTRQMLDFDERAQAWLKANTKLIHSAVATGPVMMFAHLSQRNIVGMLTGTFFAMILISFCLILAFRSFKIGLLSLLPNLLPAFMGFGVWALISGQVGLALSVVTGITLGIVVDDTVHFLSKYLRARRSGKLDATGAIRYAFQSVGYALITTTVVLAVGFLILGLSAFQLNSQMGIVTALIIILGLAVELFFIPPLLIKLEGKIGAP